jgi:predicted transcriptional regulator
MNESADADKSIRLAICSERRQALLLSLYEGKKPIFDLHEALESSSPALIHALRELAGNHLVRQDSIREYELTPIGRSATRKIIDFHRTMEAFTKHETFWSAHDLRGIPDLVFDRIGGLRDATLITGTPTDVFKAMRRFVELLQESAVVKLVSPIYIPNIDAIVFEKFVSEKTRIELVLTEEVLRHFISEAEHARLKEARGKHLTLRVLRDDPKLVILVTDRFMALALYRLDDKFDHSCMLGSENPEAIAWGQQLFHHYLSEAVDVVL